METLKTSIRLEPELLAKIKLAAQAWARKQGMGTKRKTALWIDTVLRVAAAEELGEPSSGAQGGGA